MTSLPDLPDLEISYPPLPSILGISPHGLLAGVGILVGIVVVRRAGRRRGLDTSRLEGALTWGVLAGIIGARADYVLTHLDQFTNPLEMVKIWQGGLALAGGLIAGGLTVALLLRRARLPVGHLLDVLAPAVAVAIGVGRLGDLLLTDHLGGPTAAGWALAYRVPAGAVLAPGFGPSPAAPPGPGQACTDVGVYFAGCSYHLTPGYDLLAVVALWVYLTVLSRRRHPVGAVFVLFVIGYAVQRLVLDSLRRVDERLLWGLSSTQLISIAAAAAGIAALAHLYTASPGRSGGGGLPGGGPDDPDDPSPIATLSRPGRRPAGITFRT